MRQPAPAGEFARGGVGGRIAVPSSPGYWRVPHAEAEHTFADPPPVVFAALAGLFEHERWAPEVQGPAHWLGVRKGGVGSRFVVYHKPGPRHMVHFGEVREWERDRVFGWTSPFFEWPRATVVGRVELTPAADGGTRVRETLVFEAREDHMRILGGFLETPGYDSATLTSFLHARLEGLDRLLRDRTLDVEPAMDRFARNELMAADWSGRVPRGNWVRVLYADGDLTFDGPPDVVFNAFTRFARYRDWTHEIHVGAEWLDIRRGGVGSRFLLWEKPGDRQVMHDAVVTELERGRKFTWRAPFAEWGKVFIGTSMIARPGPGGTTRVHHVLFADLAEEYLPVFGGFGSLHGFDLEFETFHIHEEARGFNELLRAGALEGEEREYLFDRDERPARDWPLQDGRRWPEEALTLRPDRIITYEDLVVELSETLSGLIPAPGFMRRYRDLARLERFRDEWES